MRTECNQVSMRFARLKGRDVVADFGGGAMTSDAGALLLGATDRAIGLVDRFAACFSDGRAAGRVVHDVATLVGQRVFGIALGYEDLLDHDELRHDPVLGTVLGRLEARRSGCAPLAGKSTLNRLEHAPVGEATGQVSATIFVLTPILFRPFCNSAAACSVWPYPARAPSVISGMSPSTMARCSLAFSRSSV